ncbi:MAG: TIGR00289 family protein [Methanobrevibacter sp.]|jgi:predicted ATP pyrophosphatase (TIGR00289 family)|nr:TIGR00289 family protein [Methanobrevibacter sp.]
MISAILFSGGKDSTMACFEAMANNDQIAYLLTMESENDESYMFHVPNIHITDLIAKALEIPIIRATTPGNKEEELLDLKKQLLFLKNQGVEAIYSGALFSTYQKSRIDKLCKEIGLKSISPLWHINEEEYMNRIVDLGFEVILTGVYAEGLDESWLGRKIDKIAISELKAIKEKYEINIAFEGGEAETLAIDGPIFKKKIKIIEAKKIWNFDNGTYNIKKAILEDK